MKINRVFMRFGEIRGNSDTTTWNWSTTLELSYGIEKLVGEVTVIGNCLTIEPSVRLVVD